jgi:hypothetical protein
MRAAWFIRRFPRSDSRCAPAARGHLGRRSAVIGGEAARAGEAGDVTDVADHRGGHRGADPEDLRHRGARGPDRRREFLLDVAPLDVDAAQVSQELLGQHPAGHPGRAARFGPVQDPGGPARGDALVGAAGDQVAEHRVQPAHDLVAGPAQVAVPLGPDLQHGRVVIGPTAGQAADRSAATATERASFGSFLSVAP